MKNNSGIIGGFDALYMFVSRGLGAGQDVVQQGVNGVLHVARGQRTSIVEAHALPQMEDIGQRIGNLPALGQHRLQIEVLIAAEKRIEDQHINALGLRVQPHARIEIRWAALDDHDQGVGVGAARATSQKQGKYERGQTAKTEHAFIRTM